MKIKNLKKDAGSLFILAATLLMTSCNRGYGCPTNFSFEDLFGYAAQLFASILF